MEYMVARVSQQYTPALPQQQPESAAVAVAVADHRPPPVSQRTRGVTAAMRLTRQRRQQALEQEVVELKHQLSNEQTVHHILERALQPSSARSAVLTIPAFIPTKAKELLAELLLVEEEIARLEAQIQNMKISSGTGSAMPKPPPDNGATANYITSQQSQPQPPQTSNGIKSPRPSVADSNNNNVQQQQSQKALAAPPPPTPPEIKSMFFISQAMTMDGDYLNKKHVKSPPKAPASPGKNNSIFAMPPPRHSLDTKQQQQHPTKILHELPISKSSTNQPNKLSERIVKCLVCIFIRLLRSSRVADLDKAANLARSGNLQAGSFSFRIDTSLNVAAKDKDRDRGQQDHYGIFAIQDAIVRDIGPYKNLVRFTSSAFDLRGFSSSPLVTKIREMLQALQQLDLRFLNHHQKLAFWLNVYNTCIMHGILQHGLPSNSEKLHALKNKATINVSGQKFNALVIENFILRQPSSVKEEFLKCDVDVEEQQVRELYALKTSEPNTLFALCCGIRSSPAVRTPDIQSRSCGHGSGEGETGVPAGIAGGDVHQEAAYPKPHTLQHA